MSDLINTTRRMALKAFPFAGAAFLCGPALPAVAEPEIIPMPDHVIWIQIGRRFVAIDPLPLLVEKGHEAVVFDPHKVQFRIFKGPVVAGHMGDWDRAVGLPFENMGGWQISYTGVLLGKIVGERPSV